MATIFLAYDKRFDKFTESVGPDPADVYALLMPDTFAAVYGNGTYRACKRGMVVRASVEVNPQRLQVVRRAASRKAVAS